MERIRLIPFGKNQLPGLVLIQLRRSSNGAQHVQRHARGEAGLDGAQDKGFVEHPARRIDGVQQLVHGAPGRFDKHAALARAHRG